jgi:hypothetical protein
VSVSVCFRNAILFLNQFAHLGNFAANDTAVCLGKSIFFFSLLYYIILTPSFSSVLKPAQAGLVVISISGDKKIGLIIKLINI